MTRSSSRQRASSSGRSSSRTRSSSSRSQSAPPSVLNGIPAQSWVWLGLLALFVALLGGSSRPDAVQIAALRPLAALFLIPALATLKRSDLREAKVLVMLLGLTALWMAIQLIPLPPALWQSLPGRDIVSEVGRLTGIEGIWRPIAWVPSRGWNSLASLVLPIAALLLALAMRAPARMLLLILAALGLLDALLGLAQVLTGQSSPLYIYTYTNRGSPVGIFANENHSAVFSAISMLVIARLGSTASRLNDSIWLRVAYPASFIAILLSVLASGSRAGLVTSALALLASGLIVALAFGSDRTTSRSGKAQEWMASHPKSLVGLFALVIGVLLTAFYQLERAPGFESLFARGAVDSLRAGLLPVLLAMASDLGVLGIGFGSFEEVYHIYEPTELLLPVYINQAHNDWLQLVIEGGLPAALLLLALLSWIAVSVMSFLRHRQFALESVVFWSAVIAVLSVASLVDYPLRGPTFQVVTVWLLLALGLERRAATATN